MSNGPGGFQIHKELIQVATGFIGLLVALVGHYQVILTTQPKAPVVAPTPLAPPATFVSARQTIGGASREAEATRSATASACPTPPAPEDLVWRDDFGANCGYWQLDADPPRRREVVDGRLVIHVEPVEGMANLNHAMLRDLEVGDVAVQVRARKLAGSSESYQGVVCRWQDVGSYYALG